MAQSVLTLNNNIVSIASKLGHIHLQNLFAYEYI